MAKTARLKKQSRSTKSRAARREASPSINLDKSLKTVTAPATVVETQPSVLAVHRGAGITKKVRRGRHVSTRARKRQEKGVERAALVMDRTENKRTKSVGKEKTVKARRAAWEELNEKILGSKVTQGKPQHVELDEGKSTVNQRLQVTETSFPDQADMELEDAVKVALPADEEDEIL